MEKELTTLEALEKIGSVVKYGGGDKLKSLSYTYKKEFGTIKEALKDYEEIQQVLKDFNIINTYELIECLKNIKTLENSNNKNLHILEIFKEKEIDVIWLRKTKSVEEYNMPYTIPAQLTPKEYKLLKEFLNNE